MYHFYNRTLTHSSTRKKNKQFTTLDLTRRRSTTILSHKSTSYKSYPAAGREGNSIFETSPRQSFNTFYYARQGNTQKYLSYVLNTWRKTLRLLALDFPRGSFGTFSRSIRGFEIVATRPPTASIQTRLSNAPRLEPLPAGLPSKPPPLPGNSASLHPSLRYSVFPLFLIRTWTVGVGRTINHRRRLNGRCAIFSSAPYTIIV